MNHSQRCNLLPEYAQSRMSPFDAAALRQLLNGRENLRILEIGSWMGAGSTQIFAEYAELLVCVDHWKGNENVEHKKLLKECDPFFIFQENTKTFTEKIVAIKSNSMFIGELISNNSFDFVFIDGDHRYSQTILDIRNCLPKLKDGGIICGHDCEFRLGTIARIFTSEEMSCDHIDSPSPRFRHCHPGVVHAVDEVFGQDVNLFADTVNELQLEDGRTGYSTIWWKNLL